MRTDQPWARLYQLRNKLAHRRLPDIDEDEVLAGRMKLSGLRRERASGRNLPVTEHVALDQVSAL